MTAGDREVVVIMAAAVTIVALAAAVAVAAAAAVTHDTAAVFFTAGFAHADTAGGGGEPASVAVVTSRGNVFVLDPRPPVPANATASGSIDDDPARLMADGLGISARLVHGDYGAGTVIRGGAGGGGGGGGGIVESIRPYHRMPAATNFVVSAPASDRVLAAAIPEFYAGYHLEGSALVKTTAELPSLLAVSDTRRMSGNITMTSGESGMMVSGHGRLVVRLADSVSNQTLVFRGHSLPGSDIRIVQSPYDLMRQEYLDGRGFVLNKCTCDPRPWSLSVLAGTADDSEKTGVFRYGQTSSASVYHGKCCRGLYVQGGSGSQEVEARLVVALHESGYHVVSGDTTDPHLLNVHDTLKPGARIHRVNYNYIHSFDHVVYDTLPVRVVHDFGRSFETRLTVPEGPVYVVFDSSSPSAGGGNHTQRLGATAGGQTAVPGGGIVRITGLAPDTGYVVATAPGGGRGSAVAAGLTSSEGVIHVDLPGTGELDGVGGRLYLYNDSLTHVRAGAPGGGPPPPASGLGQVAFDHANDRIITLPASAGGDRAYNIHAYVKIPVVHDGLHLSGIGLSGAARPGAVTAADIALGYLDGAYDAGDDLLIPVVPAYRHVHMTINGNVTARLAVGDVLGGTGLRISDPVSSTVTVSNPAGFTESVEATTGVVTYMVAPNDGSAKVRVRALVSGSSEITNARSYVLAGVPLPPPPPPDPVDPMTAWVEVYVNGEPRNTGGTDTNRHQIFFSDTPVENHEGGATPGGRSHHTARFSYPEVDVTAVVSVPVKASDFVEFYFYNHIYAQGSIPPLEPGFADHKQSSRASATAVLRHASIHAGL